MELTSLRPSPCAVEKVCQAHSPDRDPIMASASVTAGNVRRLMSGVPRPVASAHGQSAMGGSHHGPVSSHPGATANSAAQVVRDAPASAPRRPCANSEGIEVYCPAESTRWGSADEPCELAK